MSHCNRVVQNVSRSEYNNERIWSRSMSFLEMHLRAQSNSNLTCWIRAVHQGRWLGWAVSSSRKSWTLAWQRLRSALYSAEGTRAPPARWACRTCRDTEVGGCGRLTVIPDAEKSTGSCVMSGISKWKNLKLLFCYFFGHLRAGKNLVWWQVTWGCRWVCAPVTPELVIKCCFHDV